MFQGFPEDMIRFFLDLRFHNDTAWFHQHRDEYLVSVRKPFYAFIEAMEPAMRSIDPRMELRPHLCLARINRDVRFTKDKSPYRDHLWLLFRRAGEEKADSVMYWFEISSETVMWGLGFWGRNQPAMEELRSILEHYPSKITEALKASGLPDPKFRICGEAYQRKKIPDTVPENLRPLYPLKEIYIQRNQPVFSEIYSEQIVHSVSDDFTRLKPMYQLLREAADLSKEGNEQSNGGKYESKKNEERFGFARLGDR